VTGPGSETPARGAALSPVTAYIGVGANLGFARDSVLNALADLERLPQTEFVAASSLYQSPSMGAEGPDYVNAVAEISTRLSADDLLFALLAIEKQHGRVRTTKNAPRTLDLDLLLYGDAIIQSPTLAVPHPRLTERAFVLKPLIELAPGLEIPGKGAVSFFLNAVAGQKIWRIEP
jgi:2-amino-4-hydroxy-6-hydroxymethyldihydropteridine diphosphokinase